MSHSQEFEDHVRDLLAKLYDYRGLVSHPIGHQIRIAVDEDMSEQSIRQYIIDAIDDLKPPKEVDAHTARGRIYHVLWMRYVEEQKTREILYQLSLSERQFYRVQQQAIQTISQVIWDKINRDKLSNKKQMEDIVSVNSELQHLLKIPVISLNLYDEVASAIESINLVAQQKEIEIILQKHSVSLNLNVRQPVLRHFLISMLNQIMNFSAPQGDILVEVTGVETRPIVRISISDTATNLSKLNDTLPQYETLQQLMKMLHSEILIKSNNLLEITFTKSEHQILMIDDNPDTIDLFKRYLVNSPYTVISASTADDGIQIAQQTQPACILLDIMLPEKDGWQVLQGFKNHSLTQNIPILICSVLNMKDFAHSMGADGYIKKPPSRDELLAILRKWVN